jgi:hypothetical protein
LILHHPFSFVVSLTRALSLFSVLSLPTKLINAKFTTASNYAYLSNDEKTAVVAVAYLFSPDVLLGKVFFPVCSIFASDLVLFFS